MFERYRVKAEYLPRFFGDLTDRAIATIQEVGLTESELREQAARSSVSIDEIMQQVEEI